MISEDTPFGSSVITGDGSITIKDRHYDECYHSHMGAMFEAKALYVVTSGFQDAVTQNTAQLKVVDIGLGLGYNVLATIEAWVKCQNAKQSLHILSLEANHCLVEAIASTKAPWQPTWEPLWKESCAMLVLRDGEWRATIPHPQNPKIFCFWRIVVGNAANLDLPKKCFDDDIDDIAEKKGWNFFWQDPFSPRKNPELWTAEWFSKLRSVAAKDAVLVTYSVARTVKNALTEAGWSYTLLPTPGIKRKWLKACLF